MQEVLRVHTHIGTYTHQNQEALPGHSGRFLPRPSHGFYITQRQEIKHQLKLSDGDVQDHMISVLIHRNLFYSILKHKHSPLLPGNSESSYEIVSDVGRMKENVNIKVK